jgi:hypothetical protein
VIWLDVGTADTQAIAALIRRERQRIDRFDHDDEASVLVLSIGPSAV